MPGSGGGACNGVDGGPSEVASKRNDAHVVLGVRLQVSEVGLESMLHGGGRGTGRSRELPVLVALVSPELQAVALRSARCGPREAQLLLAAAARSASC